ncbi:hypothetical protein PENSPDRAFT_748525 [Peniophora sp. CONT]|nr:hypothetical protein PENSPDRAFT_748525 [Peniophora sp. CONT]
MSECTDPGYDAKVDYVNKLHNLLGHSGQRIDWVLSEEGNRDFPTWKATAMLNGQGIGQGSWTAKNSAKKVASFRALKSLGQI